MATRPASRCDIGNVTQSFTPGPGPGQIDAYTPLPVGNGDIGGLFDPFGGTWYDELRTGTGAQRDIRTLLLTRLVPIDYWCLDGRDPQWHHFDPKWFWLAEPPTHYFAPTNPFTLRIGDADPAFADRVSNHTQKLTLADGTLRSSWRLDGQATKVESWIHVDQSLIVYAIETQQELVLDFQAAPTPKRAPNYPQAKDNPDHLRFRDGCFETSVQDGVLAGYALSNIQCPCHFAVAASPDAFAWRGSTLVLPPGRHQVFIAIGHHSLTEPRDRAAAVRGQAIAARGAGYAALRRRHVAWWRGFWNRSYVQLPDKRLEAMWFRSQYYLASFLPRRVSAMSTEGAYSDFPAFAGGHPQDTVYHLFAAISSGHPELCEGSLRCTLETLPVVEATAKHAYFLRGARFPWQATPGMLPYLEGHRNPPFSEHHQNAWISEMLRRYLELQAWPKADTRKLYPVVRAIARFWSSMLTPGAPGGDGFEVHYTPMLSQNEDNDSRDRPNVIDTLLSAKWCLRIAAEMGQRLGLDAAEAARWADESEHVALQKVRLEDGSYGVHGRHTLANVVDGKVPAQLLGVVLGPILTEYDPAGLAKTLERVRHVIDYRACSWSPGYYAITGARMGNPAMVAECLQEAFTFSQEPWIMFRENAPYGRMPYYLAAHALFVQGINEMLIQTVDGQAKLLPACPFDEVEFRLPAAGRMLTVRRRAGQVETLEDKPVKFAKMRLG